MKTFFFVALLAALPPMFVDAAESKSAWFTCNRPKTCVTTTELCGQPIAVNRKHRRAYEKWRGQARADCQPRSEQQKKVDAELVPSCVDGRCILFSPNFGAGK